jgi:hypothetical protein
LLIEICIPKVEIKILITCDNFDQSFSRKSKLILIGIPPEMPTKLISVETLYQPAIVFRQGPTALNQAFNNWLKEAVGDKEIFLKRNILITWFCCCTVLFGLAQLTETPFSDPQ